jgi:hypothetical protein
VICDGKYVFRKVKAGDRPANGWADQDNILTYFLEYEGKQVDAAYGTDCCIVLIQSFNENKGHGTKFIELWERYTCTKGYSHLEISPVSNAKLEHILENKRVFSLKEIDQYGEKTYFKNISKSLKAS